MTLFNLTSRRSRPRPDSDSELLASVAATGDTIAFETLVEKYSARVFALVVRVTGSAPDAEDITQDVMMQVYSRAGSFTGGSAVGTWIFRIAYNMAIDHERRLASRRRRLGDETPLTAAEASLQTSGEDEADPRVDLLVEAMQALPPDDRALLTLYYYDSRPVAEIAEIMHLSQSNVKVRLMRLRRRLKESITSGLTPET